MLVYVVRDDDVANSADCRIGVAEIGTFLPGHDGFAHCEVVGLPDAARRKALAAELAAWIRARLSPYMAPREVLFLEALPGTATGKVLRRSLRDG